MARSRRGGSRTPANPAPVSGPGALSRRTDGGGNSASSQPIREQPAAFYGQRQALVDQQRGAPLAAGSPGPSPQAPGPGAPTAPGLTGGVFGPSQRPGEPVSAGAGAGPGPTDVGNGWLFDEPGNPADPDEVLRAMYRAYPHPSLLRLLKGGTPRGG